MRSLLVQASTVEKAVEQGWINAGQPTEFTIKIHDFGKKNFLGFTKKPAIISIVYEPQKQTAMTKGEPAKRISRKPRGRSGKDSKTQPSTKDRGTKTRRDTKSSRERKTQEKKQPQKRVQAKDKPREERKPKETTPREDFWTDLLIADVTQWLTEMIKSLGISATFKVKAVKKILTLSFDQEIFEKHEEEKYLFSGLSYLLIQFLKKKHKKKFQGYKLLISSSRSSAPRSNTSRSNNSGKNTPEKK